jgi:hypothetical protein
MQLHVPHRHQRQFPQLVIVAQFVIVVTQKLADPRACTRPDAGALRHERIQRWDGKCARLDLQPTILFKFPEIEHIVADGNADPGRETVRGKNPIGEILDRKVRCRVDRDEGTKRGVIGVGHLILQSDSSCPAKAPSASSRWMIRASILLEKRRIAGSGIAGSSPAMTNNTDHGLLGSKRFSSPFQQSA